MVANLIIEGRAYSQSPRNRAQNSTLDACRGSRKVSHYSGSDQMLLCNFAVQHATIMKRYIKHRCLAFSKRRFGHKKRLTSISSPYYPGSILDLGRMHKINASLYPYRLCRIYTKVFTKPCMPAHGRRRTEAINRGKMQWLSFLIGSHGPFVPYARFGQ